MGQTEFKFFDSEISLDENFAMDLHHIKLPVENSPTVVKRGIIGVCTQGSADIEVNFMKCHLEKSVTLLLFPPQIVHQTFVSKDFSLMYFACSSLILDSVIFRFHPEFGSFLKENPVHKISEEQFEKDMHFFHVLKDKVEDFGNIYRKEIVMNMIRNFYLEMYNKIQHRLSENPIKHIHRIEILEMFINQVKQHYSESREVAFYANKLNITPKHLSVITKEVCGLGAKDLIDKNVVMEIKLLLRSTSKTVQEIAEELSFPDQSFLCKYFKIRTGMPPSEYRTKMI